VRMFKPQRLRPAVVTLAAVGLMAAAMAPAGASRGGGGGGGFGSLPSAAAFALNVDVDVLGAVPLDVGPVARLRVSGDAGRRFENALKVQVPPLLEALVLATGGETKTGANPSAKASARVATVKLHLLGDLLIKVLKSECHVTRDTVEVASDVVFADGSVLGIGVDMVGLQARPNSRVTIPAVGTLILNEQRINRRMGGRNGRIEVTVNALRLELDGILGRGDVIISQSVCRLSGKDIGTNLKIGSTTNGHDTSGQVGEDNGDDHGDNGDNSLLGGLLGGDGGLLNVHHLLGGNLLGGSDDGGVL
jgi:hypothetical protein